MKAKFIPLLLIVLLSSCKSPSSGVSPADERKLELDEAVQIYERAKLEDLLLTTDPLELGEQMSYPVLQQLAAQNRFEDIFNIGDELFEKELDSRFGKGVGVSGDGEQRATRLLGAIGGMDSGSCRSCHFKGGPDGSGTYTSVALMRSDGEHLDSATLRDAPHVMGLGYIELIAKAMTKELQSIALQARSLAMQSQQVVTKALTTQGVTFGKVVANPEGSFDMSLVQHVQPDLVVRPFGHKGRASTLVDFIDEALQMHHGIQTGSRVKKHQGVRKLIGEGADYDPDQDGVSHEGSAAQTLLLAAYLSMLPVPVVEPPRSPELALAWGRGRLLFDEIGCASCHVPKLSFEKDILRHASPINREQHIDIALQTHGQEPIPRKLDYGPDDQNIIDQGTPVYAFTDLRLHDLGPELADASDEPSIDGKTTLSRSVWLTRSLWGLADTAPYLHDARATTVREAILWHGGEAAAVRDHFSRLVEEDQKSILVFLASLTREPTVLVE